MIHTSDYRAGTDSYRPPASWPRGDSYPARSGRWESGRVGTGRQRSAPAGCTGHCHRRGGPRGLLRHDQIGVLSGGNPVAL